MGVPRATKARSPAFSIARFVENVRAHEPVDGRARHEWLPDGRTTLVFRVLDGGRRGDVAVAGPRTRALVKNLHGVTRAVVVQFKPGWCASLLGVAAHALTDRITPLEDIWGRAGSDLYIDLLATRDVPELLECVSRVVALRLSQSLESASARLARRAARLFEGGEAHVERVAEQLGVTSRHLRRAFSEHVGVGPKEFARTVRLQRVMRMAAASNDWGRIATDAGYYDQAHLIADFREFIGVTPGTFSRRLDGATLEGN
jgi:AraC-like DNA-binding protein